MYNIIWQNRGTMHFGVDTFLPQNLRPFFKDISRGKVLWHNRGTSYFVKNKYPENQTLKGLGSNLQLIIKL